jgi:hypothetical protein
MALRRMHGLRFLVIGIVTGMVAGLLASRSVGQNARGNIDQSHDRIEIVELLNRHQIYIDMRDVEGYAGVYAADGRYESPFASARGN